MRTMPALLAALALVPFAAGCGDDEEPAAPEGATTTGSGQEVDGTRVGMKNLRFDPEQITVKEGTKITWVNDESIQHNVVAEKGADFESELLDQDQTFEYTPEGAGTIEYVCTLHPGMDGTITVTG